MGWMKLTEIALTPNIKLTISGQRSRKLTCSDLDHFCESQFLEESRQWTSIARCLTSAKLSPAIISHRINFATVSQHDWMLITSCDFSNLVGNSCDIVRSIFVVESSKSKLTFFVSTTHKESTNIINKSSVEATSWDRFNVWFVVLIEVNGARWILNCHFLTNCGSTLTVFILAPCKNITDFCSNHSVRTSARDLNRFKVQKTIHKNRTKLLLQIRFVYS